MIIVVGVEEVGNSEDGAGRVKKMSFAGITLQSRECSIGRLHHNDVNRCQSSIDGDA